MLVTAVVTTHNRKDFVLNALKSVEQQTYPDMEIIVVDDKSTDGTKELIEEYIKNKSIKYIYSTEGLGGNHIRNIGISEAHGELIAFLDDDDEWLPEKIEKQVAYIAANPNVGVVVCGRFLIYGSGKQGKSDLNQLPNGDFSQKIFKGIFFPTSCLLVKKDLLLQCGLFDEKLRYWQEYELFMRLAQITEFGAVREYLVMFRVSFENKNTTKRLSHNLTGWQESVEYINQKHREKINELPKEIFEEYKFFIAHDGCVRAERSGNKKERHKYLQDLYKSRPNCLNLLRLLTNHFITKNSIKSFIRSFLHRNK